MPNWKKVLLSGSKASVYDITASNLPGEPNKTTDVVVISDTGRFLTASRNDFGAASGPDKAIQFAYTEDGTVFQNSGSDKFTFDEESVELIISAAGEGQINVGRTDKPSSGETLGSLNFVGTGSFTMEGPTTKIEAVATQDYTVHAKGGKLNFYTSNNGDSGTPSGLDLKMTISESGVVFNTNIIATDITASGDISSSGTITGNSLIGTVNTATQGTIDHDSLANFVANEHIDHTTVSISAGNGLTGGGTIASNRTISVDYAGTSNIITQAPDDGSSFDSDSDKIIRFSDGDEEVQDTTITNFKSGYNLVDTSGTPVDNDYAKFTDANTIEGRSFSEVKEDLSLQNVTNESKSTMFSNPTFTGNVTIPARLVHSGDTDTYINFITDQIDFYAGGQRMLTLDETAQDTVVINENSLDIDFRVEGLNDTHAIFVQGSSDHVGIGLASPLHKLDIYDSVQGATARIINNSTADTGDGLYIRLGHVGTTINSIGTQAASTSYPNPNFIRFFNGNGSAIGCIAKNGNTTHYGTTSDKRLKKDIKPLKEGLDTLLKIKPKEFKWKEGDDRIQHGFIAQEINEVYTHATIPPRNDKEYWQMEHSKLVPLLVQSIQEQQQMIEHLKKEISNLKNNG